MKVPSINVKKLDDRSKVMVNLGKEPGTKAYRLYDPETEKVLVSRDVIFEEKKSWPWSQERNVADAELETFTVVNHNTAEPREFAAGEGSNTPRSTNDSDEVTDSNSSLSSSATNSDSEADSDSEPQNFGSLRDIYANTEETELEDVELFLMGVDEPANYRQAAKEIS